MGRRQVLVHLAHPGGTEARDDRDGGHEVHRHPAPRGDPDDLAGSVDVRRAQLLVGVEEVDPGAVVHDQVQALGQRVRALVVEPQPWLGQVPGEALHALPVGLVEVQTVAGEGGADPLPGVGGARRPYGAVDAGGRRVQQTVQQEAADEAGSAREQDVLGVVRVRCRAFGGREGEAESGLRGEVDGRFLAAGRSAGAAADSAYGGGEAFEGGRGQQRPDEGGAQGRVEAEYGEGAGDGLRGEQGVAAEEEEVVLGRGPDAQHLVPHLREEAGQAVGGLRPVRAPDGLRDVSGAGRWGGRLQTAAVDLAAAGDREAVQGYQGRDGLRGQPRGAVRAQVGQRQRVAGDGGRDVGGQGVPVDLDGRFADLGVGP